MMQTAVIVAAVSLAAGQPAPAAVPDEALQALAEEAGRLRPLVTSAAAGELLDRAPSLPAAAATSVWYRPGGGYLSEAWTQAAYEALAEDERDGLREVTVDTQRYYHTFYGSPLASIRAFDVAAAHGIESFDGARVLDFGFGSVGQLRLLAACGAEAIGTEVMPLLRAMYAGPEAQGEVEGSGGRRGSVKLIFGRWPAEPAVADAAGTGFDLFVSKNTIKRGYVRPPVEVDPKKRLDFGVAEDVFLARLVAALAPGGLAIIYNIGGRPAEGEAPYDPSTDIASPWSRAEYERHGFEVAALDADDSEMIRRYAVALGWDQGEHPMDVENGLFASYTLLRRPR